MSKPDFRKLVEAIKVSIPKLPETRLKRVHTLWERLPLNTTTVFNEVALADFTRAVSSRDVSELRGVCEEFLYNYLVEPEQQTLNPSEYLRLNLGLRYNEVHWLLPRFTDRLALNKYVAMILWLMSNALGEQGQFTVSGNTVLIAYDNVKLGIENGAIVSRFTNGLAMPETDYEMILRMYHKGYEVSSWEGCTSTLWRESTLIEDIPTRLATQEALRVLFFRYSNHPRLWVYLKEGWKPHFGKNLPQTHIRGRQIKEVASDVWSQFNNFANPVAELYRRLVDTSLMEADRFFTLYQGSEDLLEVPVITDHTLLSQWFQTTTKIRKNPNAHRNSR